jgi:hypothetical protein
MGFATYFIEPVTTAPFSPTRSELKETGAPTVISNGAVSLTFDATGRLSLWTDIASGVSTPLSQVRVAPGRESVGN